MVIQSRSLHYITLHYHSIIYIIELSAILCSFIAIIDNKGGGRQWVLGKKYSLRLNSVDCWIYIIEIFHRFFE